MSAERRLAAVLADLELDMRLAYHWIQGLTVYPRPRLTGPIRAAERAQLLHYAALRRLALGR